MNTKVIKEKLQELNRLDKNRSVFGANRHGYRSFPVSSLEINNFEKQYGFEIPENFKEFLIEIGYGAGPYYGIYSIKEIEDELSSLKDIELEEKIQLSPSIDFPFNQETIKNLNNQIINGSEETFLKTYFPSNGSFPITHQGCTYWSCLIVRGELTGTVWYSSCPVGFEGSWIPAKNSSVLTVYRKSITGNLETKWLPEKSTKNVFESKLFEVWYEEWLDDSLLALEQLQKLNSWQFFNKWTN